MITDKAPATIGDAIQLLAAMLSMAEHEKNKEGVTRYTDAIGRCLNQINLEAQTWNSK